MAKNANKLETVSVFYDYAAMSLLWFKNDTCMLLPLGMWLLQFKGTK